MLLAGGLLGLEFVFPFASNTTASNGYFTDSVYNIFDNNILLGLISVGILLSFIAIFLFKNRKLQSRINWFTMSICIAILGVGFFFLTQDQSGINEGTDIGVGSFLPLISLILLFIANRYIGKDENLVKSMDRLR